MVVNKHELNSFSEDGKEKRKRYLSMSLKYEVDDICGIDGIKAVFPPNSTWCIHDIDENILLYLVIPWGLCTSLAILWYCVPYDKYDYFGRQSCSKKEIFWLVLAQGFHLKVSGN